jgi:hypothetical protein
MNSANGSVDGSGSSSPVTPCTGDAVCVVQAQRHAAGDCPHSFMQRDKGTSIPLGPLPRASVEKRNDPFPLSRPLAPCSVSPGRTRARCIPDPPSFFWP